MRQKLLLLGCMGFACIFLNLSVNANAQNLSAETKSASKVLPHAVTSAKSVPLTKNGKQIYRNRADALFWEAYRTYRRQDLVKTEALLNEALTQADENDKNLVNIYYYLGVVAFKNHQLKMANDYLLKAKSNFVFSNLLGPDERFILIRLSEVAMYQGDFTSALFYIAYAKKLILTSERDTGYKEALKLQDEINEARSKGAYTNKIEKIARWHDDTSEIYIYFEPSESLQDWDPRYLQIAKKAFSEWSEKINHRFNFIYIDDPNAYDVKFSWSQTPFKKDAEDPKHVPVGINASNRLFNIVTLNDIGISLTTLDGRLNKDEALYSNILHEVGHMLGLSEHSDNPGDIMYPQSTGSGISERDLKTFEDVYKKTPTYTNIPGVRISQLIGFNELGEAMVAKDYKRAYNLTVALEKEYPTSGFDYNYIFGIIEFSKENIKEAIPLFEKVERNYSIHLYPDRYLGACYILLAHQYNGKLGAQNQKIADAYYEKGIVLLQAFIGNMSIDAKEKKGLTRLLHEGMRKEELPRFKINDSYSGFYRRFR